MKKAFVLYFVLLFAGVVCADYLLNRRLAFQAAPPAGDTMVTNGLIVRYWLDEAASGTSPTTLEDDGLGTDMDLTITYDSAVWTNAGGSKRGIHCSQDSGDQRAEFGSISSGNKLYDALDETAQTTTMEVVASFNAFASGGGRVVHIDDTSGANGEFTFRAAGLSSLQFYLHTVDDNQTVHDGITVAAGERIVYHIVFDSTLGTEADRVKWFTNGVEVADSNPTVTQNTTVQLDVTESFILMNRESGGSFARSFEGVLHYAAIYDIAFDANQISTNYNRLKDDDDGP